MQTYNIAVVAGDGIGPEVTREAIKVLNTVAELDGSFRFSFTEYPWGCEYYLKTGEMMPENGLDLLRGSDAMEISAFSISRADGPFNSRLALSTRNIKMEQG